MVIDDWYILLTVLRYVQEHECKGCPQNTGRPEASHQTQAVFEMPEDSPKSDKAYPDVFEAAARPKNWFPDSHARSCNHCRARKKNSEGTLSLTLITP